MTSDNLETVEGRRKHLPRVIDDLFKNLKDCRPPGIPTRRRGMEFLDRDTPENRTYNEAMKTIEEGIETINELDSELEHTVPSWKEINERLFDSYLIGLFEFASKNWDQFKGYFKV